MHTPGGHNVLLQRQSERRGKFSISKFPEQSQANTYRVECAEIAQARVEDMFDESCELHLRRVFGCCCRSGGSYLASKNFRSWQIGDDQLDSHECPLLAR